MPRLHSWQRTYHISTGTGSLELSVLLFSPEIFTSNATFETETPSEDDAITFTSEPSKITDDLGHGMARHYGGGLQREPPLWRAVPSQTDRRALSH